MTEREVVGITEDFVCVLEPTQAILRGHVCLYTDRGTVYLDREGLDDLRVLLTKAREKMDTDYMKGMSM